jgi:hypothetical protein
MRNAERDIAVCKCRCARWSAAISESSLLAALVDVYLGLGGVGPGCRAAKVRQVRGIFQYVAPSVIEEVVEWRDAPDHRR